MSTWLVVVLEYWIGMWGCNVGWVNGCGNELGLFGKNEVWFVYLGCKLVRERENIFKQYKNDKNEV
jgi:hypothetical protein